MAVRSPYGTHGTQGRPDVRGGHERSDEAPRGPYPAAYGTGREHPATDVAAAPGTPEFRRPSRPRAGKRTADPFDPVWVATELRALAERALRAGGAELDASGTCALPGHDRTPPGTPPDLAARARTGMADPDAPADSGATTARDHAGDDRTCLACPDAPSARQHTGHDRPGPANPAAPADPGAPTTRDHASLDRTGMQDSDTPADPDAAEPTGHDRPGPANPAAPADPDAAATPEHTGRDLTAPAGPGAPTARDHTAPTPSGPTTPPTRSVNDQLLEALWPWALRTAAHQAARLPPGADRDAVHGEILWEVFQAVRRIDWQRYDVWPALLKARLRAAWSAAARAEDPLTRGERQARTAYLARVEAETQRLGRMLTSAERYAIARRLRPSGGTATVVLGRRLLSSAGGPGGLGDPAAIVQAATATTPDDDPADLLQRDWLRCAVRRWVAHDLPPDLRSEVSALLERDEADRIGHALLRRLAPYATALHRRIDD
ncbi:hypothetical protein [Streptomyces sp. CA-111067]|uniref:hypothetical protein n=1 Tax=Streptomyces sp. CA-111067 TaxID=3240046 RepID=UPI003D98F793